MKTQEARQKLGLSIVRKRTSVMAAVTLLGLLT